MGVPAVKPFRIPIERLQLKANVPAGVNPLVLMSLAYMLRSSGADPEPIVVRRLGRRRYRVMDGRHRFLAAVIAGRRDVLAIEVNPAALP